ncbi:MAG: DUF3987 domain-containing protein [bacterium]
MTQKIQKITIAQHLITLGLSPLPIAPASDGPFSGKNPSYVDPSGKATLVAHKPYQDRFPTDEELAEWFANPINGIGYLHTKMAPNLRTIDIDRKHFDSQAACDAVMTQILGAAPTAWVDQTPSGGYHVAVQMDAEFTNFGFGDLPHVGELLGPGRFVAIAPTTGYSRVQDGGFVPADIDSLGIRPTKTKKTAGIPPLPSPSVASMPLSIPLELLGTPQSQDVLGGKTTGDRSADLTGAIQEWQGWINWATLNGVAVSGTVQNLAQVAGEALGIGPDRVFRILATVDPGSCMPAAQHRGGDVSCWKRVASLNRSYRDRVPQETVSPAPTLKQPLAPTPTNDAAQAEAAKVAGICNARLDPNVLFPPQLAQPLAHCAKSLCVGVEGFISPLLATTASLIGNGVTISPKPDWVVGPTLWTATIARSGQAKTPPQRAILRPLQQMHSEAQETFTERKADYKAEMKAYEAATKRGEEATEPTQPNPRMYYIGDTTLEALLQAHCQPENHRGLLVNRYELSGLILGMNQYKSKGNDRQAYLELADGDPINRLTKTEYLSRPDSNVCVTGGIPPSVLDQIGDDDDADGLWARFLMFTLPYVPRVWNESSVNMDALLLAIYQRLETLGTVRLTLETTAKERFVSKWLEWGETAYNAPEGVSNAYSKAPQKVLAVALNLHCIWWALGHQHAIPTEVQPWAIDAAIYLVEYSLGQVVRRKTSLALELNPQQVKLIELSQSAGTTDGWIKTREICQRVRGEKGKRLKTDDAKNLIATLSELGIGETREADRGAIEWRYSSLTGTTPQAATSAACVDTNGDLHSDLHKDLQPQPAPQQGYTGSCVNVDKNLSNSKNLDQGGGDQNLSTLTQDRHNVDTAGVLNVDNYVDPCVDTQNCLHKEHTATGTPKPPTEPGQLCRYVGSDPNYAGKTMVFQGFVGVGCEVLVTGATRSSYLDDVHGLQTIED